MKKSEVIKNFIPITAMDQHNILTRSGIKFVNIRTGNKFQSARNIKISDPNTDKRNWDTIIYAYNEVEDPSYIQGRNLEQSEIYINPKYLFLLDFSKDMIEVSYKDYTNFITDMPNSCSITLSFSKNSWGNEGLEEYIIYEKALLKIFKTASYFPIVARKIIELDSYRYYLSPYYKDYLERGYFNG